MQSATLRCMSKPVRIPDDLAEQIEALAHQERRSLANMVQVLLVHAIDKRRYEHEQRRQGPSVEADAQPRDIPARSIHVKTDFK